MAKFKIRVAEFSEVEVETNTWDEAYIWAEDNLVKGNPDADIKILEVNYVTDL